MGKLEKTLLKKLYQSGKSMSDIANYLKCSTHKVVYWMNKHKIKRRNRSEASYIKQNPQGDPFKIKRNLSKKDMYLYGLGIGIYLGEGTKTHLHAIRVSNSNPTIIKIFIKFLLNICQLKKDKLCYSIICFNDSNTNEVVNYWAKQLKTSAKKFGKIVQIPPQGKGIYKKKSKFGVCTVSVCNTKLRSWLLNQLNYDSPR